MGFVVTGLSAKPFLHLYGLSDEKLAGHGVKRYTADAYPGFPDRIEMREAKPGERLLLLNHVSQPKNTPYRASHAIFILEGAQEAYRGENEIPEVMQTRMLSLRAFDPQGMMVDAALAQANGLVPAIMLLLENPLVSCIHAHNATRGCFAGQIERA
jgi:Protein of unknown function (DUF1203)